MNKSSPLRSPRHSYARLRLASLLCIPVVIAGVQDLWRTDAVMQTIEVPTWTTSGQAELQQMIHEAEVGRLVVSDYESYGLLEVLAADVQVEHAWGMASERMEMTWAYPFSRMQWVVTYWW